MNEYVIITDSTCDLSEELIEKMNVNIIPMQFNIDNNSYRDYPDKREMDSKTFYDHLRNGIFSKTNMLNPQEIEDACEPFLKNGNDVLLIAFSSGLSGTCNSMRLAKESLSDKYPNNKILVIDSLCASMGEGLFSYYASLNKKGGMSIEDNYKNLLELRKNVSHWFTVDDIDHLRRGGRIGSVSAFLAKTLKIKPVLNVDDEGHLIPRMKKIGRKNALKELKNQLDKTIDRTFKQTVFISHGDALNDACFLKELVLQNENVKEVYINDIGPVIGSHSGPGTVALFFIASHR